MTMQVAADAKTGDGTGQGTGAPPDAKPGEGTDPKLTSQSGENGDKGGESKPDPVAEAVAAEIAKRGLKSPEEFAKDLRDREREALYQNADQVSKSSWAEVTKSVTATLTKPVNVKFTDGDGAEREAEIQLTAEQVQKLVIDPFNGHNSTVREAMEATVYADLALIADEILPDDEAREAFVKAAHEKDPATWLQSFAEVFAPSTKAWQTRERAHEAEVKKAKADGYIEGQKSPIGDPNTGGGKGSSGALTRDRWLQMTPDERAQAWRERPAEVQAIS